MEYITSQEAAKKWKKTRRSVQLYCTNGKIPGAVFVGSQWLIPNNAQMPCDRRRKSEKLTPELDDYHFPALIYSRYFTSPDVLSDDERLLLEAQLLNIRGQLAESVQLCRRIISESDSQSVKFGAFCTNAVNFQLLGLVSELDRCMKYMENVCSQHPRHEEDYRLLLSSCNFHQTFKADLLFRTDVTKLSPDSLVAYECILSNVLIFSPDKPSKTTIMLQQAFLRNLELRGITPAVMVSHGIIASLCARTGDIGEQHRHIEEACRIGYENGYIRLLAKESSLAPEVFNKYLSKTDSDFAKLIEQRRNTNAENWRRTYEFLSGKKFGAIADAERDIVMLLFYGMSVKEIAMLKNITVEEISHIIDNLRIESGVSSREELVKYYNRIFHSPEDTNYGEL